MRRLPVPNLNAPLVDMVLGRVLRPWNNFFMQFTQDAPAVNDILVTGSPLSFTTSSGGTLSVVGGTVSSIVIVRGQVTIPVASSTVDPVLVPLSIGDTAIIIYSVAPTVRFLGD